MAGGKKLTQEEEILLQDFSRTVSKKSQALFYLNALMITILPLCKYLMVNPCYDLRAVVLKLSKI